MPAGTNWLQLVPAGIPQGQHSGLCGEALESGGCDLLEKGAGQIQRMARHATSGFTISLVGFASLFFRNVRMGVPLSYLYAYHWFWNVVKGA